MAYLKSRATFCGGWHKRQWRHLWWQGDKALTLELIVGCCFLAVTGWTLLKGRLTFRQPGEVGEGPCKVRSQRIGPEVARDPHVGLRRELGGRFPVERSLAMACPSSHPPFRGNPQKELCLERAGIHTRADKCPLGSFLKNRWPADSSGYFF